MSMQVLPLQFRHAPSLGGSGSGPLRWSTLNPTPFAPLYLSAPVLMDVEMQDSDAIGQLMISGAGDLVADPSKNTRLLASGILTDGGIYRAGSASARHPTKHRIDLWGRRPTVSGNPGGGPLITGPTHFGNTPTGNNGTTNDNGGLSRGLVNMGGTVSLYGQSSPVKRRLNAHYVSGTWLELDSPVTLPAGCKVLVTPSGFISTTSGRTEERITAAAVVNSTMVPLTSALGYPRWGRLQYVTDAGLSLTQDAWTAANWHWTGSGTSATYVNTGGMKGHTDARQEIDERAWVFFVDDRNVQIAAYDLPGHGTDLADFEFGVHTMDHMGARLGGTFVMDSVQVTDYGQKGLLGRYGAHPHFASYYDATFPSDMRGLPVFNPVTGLSDGAFADGQWRVKDCVFYKGHNNAIVQHAAINAQTWNNVFYDAYGAAYKEEDGSEIPDTQDNLAVGTRGAADADALKFWERTSYRGGVGFWFATQQGKRWNNWAVDILGTGWWNAYSYGLYSGKNDAEANSHGYGALGMSAAAGVKFSAFWDKPGDWNGNSAFCIGTLPGTTGGIGGNTFEFPRANDGTLEAAELVHTTDDGTPTGNLLTTVLKRMRLYKCTLAYHNAVLKAQYDNPSTANCTQHFEGKTGVSPGIIGAVGVYETLNHESHALAAGVVSFMASYHGSLPCIYPSLYSFKSGVYTVSGAQEAVQKGACIQTFESYLGILLNYPLLFLEWCTYDCDTIWQTPPHHLTELVTTYDAYTGTANPGPKFAWTGFNRYGHTECIFYDHFGIFSRGTSQAGKECSHVVFNQPFFTYGLPTALTPLQHNPESGSTTEPFFGIQLGLGGSSGDSLDPAAGATRGGNYSMLFWGQKFQRADVSALAPVAGAVWQMPDSFFPTTSPPPVGTASALQNFHQASAPRNGYTIVDFSTSQFAGYLPTQLVGYLAIGAAPGEAVDGNNPNLLSTDWSAFAFPCSTSVTPGVTVDGQAYTSKSSKAAFIAGGAKTYWQDTANSRIWIKFGVHRAVQTSSDHPPVWIIQ